VWPATISKNYLYFIITGGSAGSAGSAFYNTEITTTSDKLLELLAKTY
jgi:hypothetical protein